MSCVDFYFGDAIAGCFIDVAPTADGEYRWEIYRTRASSDLLLALQSRGRVDCHYLRDDVRVHFFVVGERFGGPDDGHSERFLTLRDFVTQPRWP